MIDFFFILIALILVLLNAFFVAAEFAMVKLRQTRVAVLRKTHGLRGKILFAVHQKLDAYLSACQLGITLASLGLGWVGEPAFAHLLQPVFQTFEITSPEFIKVASFFTGFAIISFLHIVVGELMPKSLAIRQSEKISIWTALPLYGFYWIMYPAIWLLNSCSNFLLTIVGLNKTNHGENVHSTDEIKLILNSSQLHGELTKDETEILEQTLDFADLQITEAMRPKEEMIMLKTNQPISKILETVVSHRYSRYPVYDPSKREIIGIVHVKDLFSALFQQKNIESLTPFLRPVLKISYQLPAAEVLRHFREGAPHFALIYKGHKKLLGFVSLDDLLHILIGGIKDEFHHTEDDYTVNADGSLLVRGDCPIFSLEKAFDCEINVGEEKPETLIGLILNQVGHLPAKNEVVEFPEFQAVILEVRGPRNISIKIIPKKIKEEEE